MASRTKLTPEEEILKAGKNSWYGMEKCASDCRVSLPTFYRMYIHTGLLPTAKLPDGRVVTIPKFLLKAYLAICAGKEKEAQDAARERQKNIKELQKAAQS